MFGKCSLCDLYLVFNELCAVWVYLQHNGDPFWKYSHVLCLNSKHVLLEIEQFSFYIILIQDLNKLLYLINCDW
jgi:hypothetical protein